MSRLPISFLLPLLLFVGCTKDGEDGGSKAGSRESLCGSTSKITNGRACPDPSQSPVVMLVLADRKGDYFAMCSGTMVTPDTVLTAAHCVDKRTGISQVLADRDGKLNLIPARETIMHPRWTGNAGNPYDVGIVKLTQPISTRPTVPLMLSKGVALTEMIFVYGYGLDENDQAQVLKEGRMEVSFFARNMIFAEYDRTRMSICSGDSGGPATAVRDGVSGIIGINSAVAGEKCLDGSIAAFTDIALKENLDFIHQHVPGIAVE